MFSGCFTLEMKILRILGKWPWTNKYKKLKKVRILAMKRSNQNRQNPRLCLDIVWHEEHASQENVRFHSSDINIVHYNDMMMICTASVTSAFSSIANPCLSSSQSWRIWPRVMVQLPGGNSSTSSSYLLLILAIVETLCSREIDLWSYRSL